MADRASTPGGPREVLHLAWPAVVNMVSFTAMAGADTYFAGKVGTPEQGAVGFAGTLTWAVFCFFVGTLQLVQTFVAQATGAGDGKRAATWGTVGLHVGLVFSIVVLPLVLAARPLFELCGIAADLIPASDLYFRIRLFGAAPFLLTTVADAWYRGIGDTKTPMVVAVVGNLLNACLDAVLVLGWAPLGIPALGVAGVAWATVAATSVQLLAYALLWPRLHASARPAPRWRYRSTLADVRQLLRVGAPAGFHWLLDLGAWTTFNIAVARLDPVQAAANIVGISIIRFSFMPGHGISTAAQTLVGQYLGARDPAAAARAGWNSAWVASVYMGAMGVAFAVFRHELVGLFTTDAAVVAIAARLMIWAAFFQIGDGIQVVLAGALRGAGDTKYVMVASLAGAWLVFIPLAFGLMRDESLGAEAGWIAINAWVIALCVMLVLRFRGDAWKSGHVDLEPRPVPEVGVA